MELKVNTMAKLKKTSNSGREWAFLFVEPILLPWNRVGKDNVTFRRFVQYCYLPLSAFKCAVDGDTADLVAACQGGNAFLPLCVGLPNVLVV